ncbi:MAG: hypothetical protein F4Z21_03525 [Acidobacteria bacterium]|nr:hypothetical protein [Acidobacteriota bacterium]
MNPEETVSRGGHRPFGLRGWQFLVNHDRTYLAQAAERSIKEAPGFEVTHLEFPNMALQLPYAYTSSPVPPCANWVLCGQTFRDFPKLAGHRDLHSRGAVSTPEDRSRNLAYMKDLFGKVKDSGLGVMAWHHVRRDLPDELAQEYPESATGDPGFLQDWEEATLTEFFEVAPEVDMLVVTSLTETPGVLEMPDRTHQVARLAGVFGAMERACRRAGKTLIIRDWGAVGKNQRQGAIFKEAMERLPGDVWIHIKNVVLDFVTNAEIPHPNLNAYPDRPMIVEFDVYGEYYGRADIPYVDPGHFCERLDGLYALQPSGVTARIAYESGREWRRYRTIFDSPNAANVVAFSRWASEAGRNRPIGEWLDFLAPSRRWQTYTWQWLADRYGSDAGPLLARVFERTPQIVHGIFAPLWCGYWHPFSVMEHTTLPWPPTRLENHGSVPWDPPPDILEVTGGLGDNDFSRVVDWMPPGTAVEAIGWCQLVSRKEEGLRLAQVCSDEISVEGRAVLSPEDYEDLDLLFRQLVAVCRADVLTGKILAASRGPRKESTVLADLSLSSLSEEAEQMEGEIRRDFGAEFFGELALRVETWGRWAEEGASAKSE